jgi:hypothetical protein
MIADCEAQPIFTGTVPINNGNSGRVSVDAGKEVRVPFQEETTFYSLISFSGMSNLAVPVSKFVSENFAKLSTVQAVLAGDSAGVQHVWVMIDEWTPGARKEVYAVQKEIMKQLEGIQFDFYVVDLPKGTAPGEMVSDIPVVFQRA